MASFDFARMRVQGRIALEQSAYPHRKLILIHSGVMVGASLLLTVLSYLLDMGIAQTGGLGGIGSRSILETIQSVLETAIMFLLPFWSISYLRVILRWSRHEDGDASTLLFGFRCLGPVIRLNITQGILYALLGIAGAYGGAAVFLLTPGAQPIYALVQELADAGITDPYAILENEAYLSATRIMAPYMAIAAGLLIAPLAYRLRFAEFALIDEPRQGAIRALVKSWRMTKKNCFGLLKLDLHFWWFYLAQGLILGLEYGDLLLDQFGIHLDIDADVLVFALYVVALICEFGLYVWKKNEVFAVYALTYDQLLMPREETKKTQADHVPWDY